MQPSVIPRTNTTQTRDGNVVARGMHMVAIPRKSSAPCRPWVMKLTVMLPMNKLMICCSIERSNNSLWTDWLCDLFLSDIQSA